MTAVDISPRGHHLGFGGAKIPDEWTLLTIFLAIQGVVWTIFPSIVWTAPRSNTVELTLWARDWFIVNYKHPGLPAWMLAAAYEICGTHLWVPLLLSQVCIAATYAFVFLLGQDLMGRHAALLGTLLLPAVSFLTLGTLKYNHNIVQLPLWVAFCFGLWRASGSDRLRWWIFTAGVAALGLYAKFTMAMVIAVGACWIMLDAEARARFSNRTLYIALLMFVLLLIPLAIALGATNFGSVEWVSNESAHKGIPGLHFIGAVGKTVGIMGAAMLAGMAANRFYRGGIIGDVELDLQRRGFTYLALMGGAPILITFMLALVKPSRLEWAAPMYSLVGLLLVAAVIYFRPAHVRLARAGLLHTLLALIATVGVLGSQATVGIHDRAVGKINRDLWPTAEIGPRFDQVWEQHTGQKLKIVAGDSWTAGMVGFMSAGHPSLFTELNLQRSPSITEGRLKSSGLLAVWTQGGTWQPDPVMLAQFPHGTETFAVGAIADAVSVNYIVIPPGQWTDEDSERWLAPRE